MGNGDSRQWTGPAKSHTRKQGCCFAVLGVSLVISGLAAATQIARNDTIFANLIWDVTPSFRLATEFTYRTTDYLLLPDNDGVGAHWQMQWKF